MTYQQFVDLINTPSVLVLLFVVTAAITYGVLKLIDRIRS